MKEKTSFADDPPQAFERVGSLLSRLPKQEPKQIDGTEIKDAPSSKQACVVKNCHHAKVQSLSIWVAG